MNLSNIEAILRKVNPTLVTAFLIRNGFERKGGRTGKVDIFENQHSDVLLLPVDQDARDYSTRLRDLLELFTSPLRSIDDIVGKIVLPYSDIFRYRIETPESTWGHLRLSYTHEAMQALYDLLRFTAAGVSTQRPDYRRISESAKLFADQCRFGQTEYGSFVLKVFCPIDPIGTSSVDSEPFGRSSVRAVVENLSFLSGNRSEDPEEPLPPTLNRQVASAVYRLKPRSELGTAAEVHVQYSQLDLPEHLGDQTELTTVAEHSATIKLGPFIYSRAQSIRDRLKRAEEFEREILRGFIIELHKDRPTYENDQSHDITLDVRFGTSWRKLRMRLLPGQYRTAVRLHDNNTQVDVDAIVDKRSTPWHVHQLLTLRPTDSSEAGPNLFE